MHSRPKLHAPATQVPRQDPVVEAKDGPELGTGGGRQTARTGSIVLLWTERARGQVVETGTSYRGTGCWSGLGNGRHARAVPRSLVVVSIAIGKRTRRTGRIAGRT